jgi:hypothetical protein
MYKMSVIPDIIEEGAEAYIEYRVEVPNNNVKIKHSLGLDVLYFELGLSDTMKKKKGMKIRPFSEIMQDIKNCEDNYERNR